MSVLQKVVLERSDHTICLPLDGLLHAYYCVGKHGYLGRHGVSIAAQNRAVNEKRRPVL
jgi:hypothetical protein